MIIKLKFLYQNVINARIGRYIKGIELITQKNYRNTIDKLEIGNLVILKKISKENHIKYVYSFTEPFIHLLSNIY